jgi:hypothetical protein
MWFTHSMMLNLFSGSCSASKAKKKQDWRCTYLPWR